MGDVSTHADIAGEVLKQLPPEREAPFFEIGNWLTDVSQFRDPFAHLSGKNRIFVRGLNRFLATPRLFNVGDLLVGIDNYVDELMGVPLDGRVKGTRPGADPAHDRPDDGILATWFRDLLLLWTCNAQVPPLNKEPALLTFPKAEIKAVFDALFTQYFPHEHLDFPPFPPDHPQRGTREPSTEQVAGEPRKLLAYSEAQLEYVADLLTKIERDWAHVVPADADPAQRRELYARFGHASHAVEDWFFHSNFTELAWTIAHPGTPAPHAPLPLQETTPADTEKFGPPVTDTTLQRKFHRRLRSPAFKGDGDDLRDDGSDQATACYTGSFGGDDIFFTLIDALGHLLGAPPPADAGKKFPMLLLLHKLLFGTDDERKQGLDDWQEQIKNDSFIVAARVAKNAGRIDDFELAAIEEMCQLEKQLLQRYRIIGLGVVGLLQQLIDTGRDTVKKSLERGAEIDGDATFKIDDDRSANGAPGENIGCHSMMCKDSTRKEPMRQAAVNCATSVATYVAKTMAGRTPAQSPAQPADFVDWAELLRFFITHPAQAAGGAGNEWWRAPLDAAAPPGPATGHTVVLRSAAEVGQRADQTHLNDLEQPYYDAAVYAEEQFKSEVNQQMVLNSGLTGVLAGGIAGAIAGGTKAGRDADKIIGGIAAGMCTGAVVAGGSACALSALGLAINRHAGVTVGSLTGITGGTIAGYFAGAAVGGLIH